MERIYSTRGVPRIDVAAPRASKGQGKRGKRAPLYTIKSCLKVLGWHSLICGNQVAPRCWGFKDQDCSSKESQMKCCASLAFWLTSLLAMIHLLLLIISRRLLQQKPDRSVYAYLHHRLVWKKTFDCCWPVYLKKISTNVCSISHLWL